MWSMLSVCVAAVTPSRELVCRWNCSEGGEGVAFWRNSIAARVVSGRENYCAWGDFLPMLASGILVITTLTSILRIDRVSERRRTSWWKSKVLEMLEGY